MRMVVDLVEFESPVLQDVWQTLEYPTSEKGLLVELGSITDISENSNCKRRMDDD